jgi:hypothetical protein
MVRNQFVAVPQRAFTTFEVYLRNRGALMQQIEQEDVRQVKEQQSLAEAQHE